MLIYAVVLIAMMIVNSSPRIVAWRKVMAEKYFKRGRAGIDEPESAAAAAAESTSTQTVEEAAEEERKED